MVANPKKLKNPIARNPNAVFSVYGPGKALNHKPIGFRV